MKDLIFINAIHKSLTEPRRALQHMGNQWFPRIGLFVVQAISLSPCRRSIEFLTSSHPTEVRFASFLSGGFTTMVVINQLEKRLAKRTSVHPCGCFSKIPNCQIHKVEKWKFLSHFRRKDFFVISHEHKDSFFVVIWPQKTLKHVKYWPRIDPTKVGHF